MNNELLVLLDYIERERGIKRSRIVTALETAILSASRKSIHPAKNLSVKINGSNGNIEAWAKLQIVESQPNNDQILLETVIEKYPDAKIGDIIDWEVTPKDFGRIAAQSAKQAIATQLNRAERETILAEYETRIGEIITGQVRSIENGNIIIDFNKNEGIIKRTDRIKDEHFGPGDMINALLLSVDTENNGPALICSRSNPNFVVKLFEREVSEIHEGIVQIMGIAREAGVRTKIAVKSNDERVDPVGSCVGVKGIRVRNITNELGLEKIDIIPYSDDIAQYTINALQPAKVQSVEVREAQNEVIVHVSEDQSKLAFGKKAQNVRLCSKLINRAVNLQTENPLEEKIVEAANSLAREFGVSVGTANRLVRAGYVTVDGIREAGLQSLLEIEKINEDEVTAAFKKING